MRPRPAAETIRVPRPVHPVADRLYAVVVLLAGVGTVLALWRHPAEAGVLRVAGLPLVLALVALALWLNGSVRAPSRRR